MAQVVIDKEKCDSCGYCVKGCPHGVLVLNSDGKAEVIKSEACEFCWTCVYECPHGAVCID